MLFEVTDVWNYQIDAEEFGVGEHHSGVDDDDVIAGAEDHHVHSKFAETAERKNCE